MNKIVIPLFREFIALGLIGLFFYLFLFVDFQDLSFNIPSELLTVNTMFLSILLEAIPFILLGVFVSALIQTYVSEDLIKRALPRNAILALFPAALLGAIFPICECAIVPIVRRLMKKGMPLHIGVVFLVGAPILNPVVFASTYYAFSSELHIAYARMGLAFVLSIVIGFIIYLLFKNSNQLKWTKEDVVVEGNTNQEEKVGKLKSTLFHASDEFFEMGKFLIMGALIASLFQTFLDRTLLTELGTNEFLSPALMMGFGYILSLCSEADAFVAASFGGTFTAGSLLAFLVYGPMLDLKNTIMLFAFFKARFVAAFILVVTIVVYIAIIFYQFLFL
ncbi:permease [Metabacillus litoralis]|uniref:permease n=1 Tax=Metabacillus TaxID=2675233 RepID=UPI000EF5B5A4|nr:permease [Metabacillus litoralis]MCM3164597.1 permease [Metabacillus litoralis]MCM3410893.1 permease [Metabacillus litoralis]